MCTEPEAPVIVSLNLPDPEDALHGDTTLLDQRRSAATPLPCLRLWSTRQCLTVTRAQARHPDFTEAAQRSAQRGWPVHVRATGGSAFFLGDDVLCISIISGGCSAERAYADLAGLIGRAFPTLAGDLTTGSQSEAPCDGRFNVLHHGRKLAGLAMRQRQGRSGRVNLTHAALLLRAPASALSAVTAFERDLDRHVPYRNAALVGLLDILDAAPGGGLNDCAGRLAAAFADTVASPVPQCRVTMMYGSTEQGSSSERTV